LALGAGGAQAIFVQSSNQNIGIGNSLPLRMVDITRSSNGGSATEFPSLAVRNTLATLGNATTTFNIARLDVQSGNGTVFGDVGTLYDAGYAGMFIGTESNHPVRLQTAGTERIRITNTGNVGIGTITPLQKLQVGGFDAVIRLSDTNGSTADFGSDTTGTYIRNFSTGAFRFVDSAGVIRMAVDTSNNFQFNSGYGSAATAYGCRAWVNFNGTGTPAIRASGNVSSITDNATGDYTVNFATGMPDTNYSMAGSGFRSSFGTTRTVAILPVTYATSSIQIYSSQTDSASGSPYDFEFVNVNIFR
jgi:hypothetical protein